MSLSDAMSSDKKNYCIVVKGNLVDNATRGLKLRFSFTLKDSSLFLHQFLM